MGLINMIDPLDQIILSTEECFWPLLGGKEELELIMGARNFQFFKSSGKALYNAGVNFCASLEHNPGKTVNFDFFVPYVKDSPKHQVFICSVYSNEDFIYRPFSLMSSPAHHPSIIICNFYLNKVQIAIKEVTGYTIRPWG